MESTNQVDILLVEDSPLDAEMTIRTLNKHNCSNSLHWVKDGQEALDFLFCEGAYESRKGMEPPQLILLDINMPKVNGMEVLRKIKEHADLRLVPVVMMTSSSKHPDSLEAYRLGVNSYIVKPVEFGEFAETVAKVGMYWMMTNHRPPRTVAETTSAARPVWSMDRYTSPPANV